MYCYDGKGVSGDLEVLLEPVGSDTRLLLFTCFTGVRGPQAWGPPAGEDEEGTAAFSSANPACAHFLIRSSHLSRAFFVPGTALNIWWKGSCTDP